MVEADQELQGVFGADGLIQPGPQTVVRRLARESGVPVSIDTYKQEVAESAQKAGAAILNDVWALTRSPGMAPATSTT